MIKMSVIPIKFIGITHYQVYKKKGSRNTYIRMNNKGKIKKCQKEILNRRFIKVKLIRP